MSAQMPEPSFLAIVQIHQIQAMLHLGLLPEPESGETIPVDLSRARFEIELLNILRDKTSGQLDAEEQQLLGEVIESLEHAFLLRQQGGGQG